MPGPVLEIRTPAASAPSSYLNSGRRRERTLQFTICPQSLSQRQRLFYILLCSKLVYGCHKCTSYVLSFPSSVFPSPRIFSVNIQPYVEIGERAEISLYMEILATVFNNIVNCEFREADGWGIVVSERSSGGVQ